jgi:hypothetical protein
LQGFRAWFGSSPPHPKELNPKDFNAKELSGDRLNRSGEIDGMPTTQRSCKNGATKEQWRSRHCKFSTTAGVPLPPPRVCIAGSDKISCLFKSNSL